MNRKFLSTALTALVLGVFSAHATSPAMATPAPAGTNGSPSDALTALFGDPVIAKGKGFEIKQSALDQIMVGAKGQAAASGQQLPPDFEVRALHLLITIQMLLQIATDADRAAGQKDADLQFTNLLKHFGTIEAFNRQLKAVGMTMEDLRAKAAQEAIAKQALKTALNVSVSDAEISSFYTGHPSDFEQPEKVHVRHLLLTTVDQATQAPLPADQVAAKRKQIDDLLRRARAGEDFATLARQYSEDPGSKDNGGEYTFPRGQMVAEFETAEFETAAFALTNNQISDVVTTKFGYHIIKLLDRTPAKTLELTSVVDGAYTFLAQEHPDYAKTLELTSVVDGVPVSESIKNYLLQQKIAKLEPDYLAKLKKTSDVEIVDAKLKADSDADEAAAAAAAAADATAPAVPDQK
jgi:peptidyl-prolyl cis-trans isomerase C